MKRLMLLGVILTCVMMSGCNTVKGAANGFNKDMDSLTGHNNTTHTTTTHSTNNTSS